ncbi:MAG: hypothetical protein FJX72_07670, partial [Armatimonadetes bacterium]|nr:hypothetical protein [Armatimonadota bacterium]
MNARIAETKECTRLALSDGLGDMLHRRRCPECRAAAGADAMLRVALDCMGTEAGGRSPGAPGPGVETVLSSLGVRGPSVAGRIFARARRAALRTAVALPITMAALAVWTVWLDRDPGVAITAQSMPSPNAFRSFAQAGAEVGGAFDIDNLAIRLPNVAQVDARAFGSLLPRASVTGPPWSFAAEPPELKATEALVAKHASALRTLRLGLWCGYAESLSASMNEGMAHLEGYRRLARLLALEGYVHEKRGRPREAVDSYLDAVK